MPDLQSALRARLIADAAITAAIGTRAFWVLVPQDAPLPYLRMQTVSDPRPQHLGGYNGARETRVQVDCFAKDYATARALAENIIAAVAEPATVAGVKFGRIKAEGPRDLGEDTSTGFIHRLSMDLLIWHSLA